MPLVASGCAGESHRATTALKLHSLAFAIGCDARSQCGSVHCRHNVSALQSWLFSLGLYTISFGLPLLLRQSLSAMVVWAVLLGKPLFLLALSLILLVAVLLAVSWTRQTFMLYSPLFRLLAWVVGFWAGELQHCPLYF
jgi:hypothetical protein